MIGGDSKFVLICIHVHKFPHTHTQLISQNGKEIEITHTLAKWGLVSRKIKKKKEKRKEFSAGVDKDKTATWQLHGSRAIITRRTP